jgi:hypothetical protein
LGPTIGDLIQEPGCRVEALIYNLSHRMKESTKRCMSLLVTNKWLTNDKLGRIVGRDQACRLCRNGKESIGHIFRQCPKVREACEWTKGAGNKEGLDLWKDQVGLLGFGLSFHTQTEAASRATAIEIIRDALARGNKVSLSHPNVGINFIERLKKAKIIGLSKKGEKADPKVKEDHPPPKGLMDDPSLV